MQDLNLSWSAFHADEASESFPPRDLNALLPLFQEEAKSPSMMCHAMDVVQRAVHFHNPDQTPVIACDQPLYSLAKVIQWNLPDRLGEDKIFVMFGGFHIEMAALKTIGD